MMIMLLAKPITTITAYITLEAGAVIAFLFSLFAQVNPNPLGFDAKSSMILAYASFLTALFGGVVAVIQVVTTAKNAKVSHELDLFRKEAAHKEEIAKMREEERKRELEILKRQNGTQAKEMLRNNAWIQEMKRKHPAEAFGMDPVTEPEESVVSALATPIYPDPEPDPPKSGTPIAVDKLPDSIVKQTAEVLEKASEVGKQADDVIQAASSILPN